MSFVRLSYRYWDTQKELLVPQLTVLCGQTIAGCCAVGHSAIHVAGKPQSLEKHTRQTQWRGRRSARQVTRSEKAFQSRWWIASPSRQSALFLQQQQRPIIRCAYLCEDSGASCEGGPALRIRHATCIVQALYNSVGIAHLINGQAGLTAVRRLPASYLTIDPARR